ncbi:MAG TPA: transposase [Clostridia bacterium]
MPRQARKKSSCGIYHIMLRGINKQNLFEDNEDRQRFIDTIGYFKAISGYSLYGYCLMDNHVHLLIKETSESISMGIKRISSSFVYWYNQKYNRCGHLFQERYKSEVVENERYFLTVLRYIHQNPIKAGITKDMEQYPWSSYSEYTGVANITDVDFALGIFSADRVKAIELFKKHTEEESKDQCLEVRETIRVSDEEVIAQMKQLGIQTISQLQTLEKKKRNEIIRIIKRIEGVSIRQMARITGISKSVISRI